MAHVLTALGAIIYAWLKRRQASFKIKLDWRIIIAAIIILFELISVHYFYTGTVTTFLGDKKVTGASYPYPYFADDWAGVAFTNYTIETGALPIIHPLLGYNTYDFPNIFVGFFAGLAEIFLILNLPPLTGYAIITIITGSLICFLVYLFLKSAKVETMFALLGALSLPWIINSAKLPGIWYLFPFIGGTIFLLISLIAFNLKSKLLAFVSSFISLLLYPPFVVFIIPTLLVAPLTKLKTAKQETKKLLAWIFILLVAATLLVFAVQRDNLSVLYSFFLRSLVRLNNEGCIPIRRIFEVVPLILIPLAIAGILEAGRRKLIYFLTPLFIGLTYWLVYSFSPKYLIIDYARIASLTSFLLMIAVGLGASWLFKKLAAKYSFFQKKETVFILQALLLFLFAVLALFYTQREAWRKIILRYDNGWEAPIISPAHQYLHPDDLELFKNLKQQRFISPPWKGLVIGAATGNYPLHNKASIIYTEVVKYDAFMTIRWCKDKLRIARLLALDYAYVPPLDCPGFDYIGQSREGLYLYKVAY